MRSTGDQSRLFELVGRTYEAAQDFAKTGTICQAELIARLLLSVATMASAAEMK